MTLPGEIIIVLLGGLLLVRLLSRVPRAASHAPMHARRAPPALRPPRDLLRISDLVTAGATSAGDVHRRLRPLLREISAGRLAQQGIGLDRDPDAARHRLGEDLWELVRADRPPPADPRGPGIPLPTLAALADRLQAL